MSPSGCRTRATIKSQKVVAFHLQDSIEMKSLGNFGSSHCCRPDAGRLRQTLVVPGMWRLHNPGFIDNLGKIDLVALGLLTLGVSKDHNLVVEKSDRPCGQAQVSFLVPA